MPYNRADNDYLQLRTMIANMCHTVSSMFDDASKALLEQDTDLAANVVERDKEVDKLDLQIDNYCLKLLALYGPKAAELRYIVAALRLIVDIERIGDHCKVIAKQVRKHHYAPAIQYAEDFTSLITLTKQMLQDSVSAFFEQNVDKAVSVMLLDNDIDKIQSKISKEIVVAITEDISKVRLAVSLTNIVRRLERIADHAKNIAEVVPYVVNGTIIRHQDISTKE